MPPKGWKKDTPNIIQPVEVTAVPAAPVQSQIEVNPKPNIIQPISVEVTQSQKPTRTSQPVKATPHKTGAWMVDKFSNKRTWIDRKMAEMMARSNPKRYSVED